MGYRLEYDMHTVKIIKNSKEHKTLKYIGLVSALILYGFFVAISGVILQMFMLSPNGQTSQPVIQLDSSLFNGFGFWNALEAICVSVAS